MNFRVVYKQTDTEDWTVFYTTIFLDVARSVDAALSHSGLVAYTGIINTTNEQLVSFTGHGDSAMTDNTDDSLTDCIDDTTPAEIVRKYAERGANLLSASLENGSYL